MTTFRKLLAPNHVVSENGELSSLELWFESVLDTPLQALPIGDLCKAVRQQLFIDKLLPIVSDVLREDPLAGERYDGELIAALAGLPEEAINWQDTIALQIKNTLNGMDRSDVTEGVLSDIEKIKTR